MADTEIPDIPDTPATDIRPDQRQAIYTALARSDDFGQLRKRYRGFAFPWAIAFMVWYLLFVICANWAPGFMSAQVLGNINVALVFGVLQFVSTFLIAWLYARHANRELDPLADKLDERFRTEVEA